MHGWLQESSIVFVLEGYSGPYFEYPWVNLYMAPLAMLIRLYGFHLFMYPDNRQIVLKISNDQNDMATNFSIVSASWTLDVYSSFEGEWE